MVYRVDPDHPYNYRWAMLPLHHAIICDAPLAIVQLLVKGKESFFVVIVIRCFLKKKPLTHSQLQRITIERQFSLKHPDILITGICSQSVLRCFMGQMISW